MGMQNQYTSSLTDKYLGKIRMKNFFSVSQLQKKIIIKNIWLSFPSVQRDWQQHCLNILLWLCLRNYFINVCESLQTSKQNSNRAWTVMAVHHPTTLVWGGTCTSLHHWSLLVLVLPRLYLQALCVSTANFPCHTGQQVTMGHREHPFLLHHTRHVLTDCLPQGQCL